MTKFIVKTATDCNESNLQSMHIGEFETSIEAAAINVFEMEEKVLRETYKTPAQLGYCPSDYESTHAYRVTLYKVVVGGELEAIKTSEEFYDL